MIKLNEDKVRAKIKVEDVNKVESAYMKMDEIGGLMMTISIQEGKLGGKTNTRPRYGKSNI